MVGDAEEKKPERSKVSLQDLKDMGWEFIFCRELGCWIATKNYEPDSVLHSQCYNDIIKKVKERESIHE